MEGGSGADLAVGAELHSNLAPLPTCCVTLNKLFTSLGFSLLMNHRGKGSRRELGLRSLEAFSSPKVLWCDGEFSYQHGSVEPGAGSHLPCPGPSQTGIPLAPPLHPCCTQAWGVPGPTPSCPRPLPFSASEGLWGSCLASAKAPGALTAATSSLGPCILSLYF